ALGLGNTGSVVVGPRGPAGGPGPAGDSKAWLSGPSAPTEVQGGVADWYLNTTNGDVFEKTSTAMWTLRTNIMGVPGTPGGPPGPTGPMGGLYAKSFDPAVYSTNPGGG